jgi:hypothetical protein
MYRALNIYMLFFFLFLFTQETYLCTMLDTSTMYYYIVKMAILRLLQY